MSKVSGDELRMDLPLEAVVEELEGLIPKRMTEFGVPGLSIALIRKGEMAWSKGYGITSATSKTEVRPDTVFSAQSLSKPVFSYAVLKLCEKGVLGLDVPLTEYLPEPYVPNEPRLGQIAARHVLSHTTGFPNWRPAGRPLRVLFTPGERFSYSGEGFVYLQKVVERLTGQPLGQFMKESVLEPFGMNRSSFVWSDKYADEAEGHDSRGNPVGRPKWDEANAAASLYSTAIDFARFLSEVLTPRGRDAFRLGEDMVKEMVTPQVGVYFTISWGLGWGIQHSRTGDSIWQWGQGHVDGSFQSFAVCFTKEKLGAVTMTNSSKGLTICENIIGHALGGEHPAFGDYLARPKIT